MTVQPRTTRRLSPSSRDNSGRRCEPAYHSSTLSSLATNPDGRVTAVHIHRQLADVFDHRLEIRVGEFRQVEFVAVAKLDFLVAQHPRHQRAEPKPTANDGH